jgi:hypothetical protein
MPFLCIYGHSEAFKIWGPHGGGYEECRLLGYKTPFRTSQETYYVSATEPSPLMRRNSFWESHTISSHMVVFLRSVRRSLVTANVVPCSPILVTRMMEALHSSETSVHTRVIRRIIPKYGILHSEAWSIGPRKYPKLRRIYWNLIERINLWYPHTYV